MEELLLRTNDIYNGQDCCHTDGRYCYCYNCLKDGFYGPDPDTYSCLKKLCYYTMNYGPSYATEIYNYLEQSQILETNFANRTVNVISLGCGFGSDRVALIKYIQKNSLNIILNYVGIDIEEHWSTISGCTPPQFIIYDFLENKLPLNDYDIVFLNKLFSTLKNKHLDDQFLAIFSGTMLPTLPKGGFVIFNDVNHIDKGRDQFNRAIEPLMDSVFKYFYNIDGAYTGNYIAIPHTQNVFTIPDGLSVSPKPEVTKAVFFQYQK